MKDLIKVLLPIVLSIVVLLLGVNEVRTWNESEETVFSGPLPATIADYQNSAIKDGIELNLGGRRYRIKKTESMYGTFGIRNGRWHRTGRWYFFSDKKIVKSTSFLKGKKSGKEYFYNEHGFLKLQHDYRAGVKHGSSARYKNRKLDEVFCFENGESVNCAPYEYCKEVVRKKRTPGVIIENY